MADDPNHTRNMDRYQQPKDELLEEVIIVGSYTFDMGLQDVEITQAAGSPEEEGLTIVPTTRREAHQLSRALRRCSIRLTAFADHLPPEPETT